MIRLPTPRNEHFAPAMPAHLFIVGISIVGVLILTAILYGSPLFSSDRKFQSSLVQVGHWVDQSGRLGIIDGAVAEKLGFPNVDVRVRERAFQDPHDSFVHTCATTDLLGFEDIIFLSLVNENDGDTRVWRATRDGELILAARLQNGVAASIGTDAVQTAFIAEKTYFQQKLRVNAFRSSPVLRDTVPAAAPAAKDSLLTTAEKRPPPALSSEFSLLFLNPWVIPAIAIILGLSVKRIRSKEDRERFRHE